MNLNANYVLCAFLHDFVRVKYFSHTSSYLAGCFLYTIFFPRTRAGYHDVHKYLPWHRKEPPRPDDFRALSFFSRSKVYSHFSALSIWRNDFFLETSASRPAWSHRVYKLHTHFTTTKHRRNTAEINWIRAHILIFIIVPVQTYLFHLCPQTARRTMSSLCCAWDTHKIVIEMEKFIFSEGLAFFYSVLAPPRLLDNQSNVQRQQQIHI